MVDTQFELIEQVVGGDPTVGHALNFAAIAADVFAKYISYANKITHLHLLYPQCH